MTIFGWDLSHYDSPDIGNALAQGIKFFTHKAGGDANDTELNAWWNNVKGIGQSEALLGAYWVLYPGSASSRADQFLARLDAQCSGWRNRPFILQVDCEKWNSDASTVPSKSDIKAFCDRLKAQCPKLTPIVYGPEWVYGSSLAGLGYPLWASAYVSGSGSPASLYPGDGSSKWHSYSGQVPAILQFTSSANIGGQTTCDANAFRGTLAQLTALVAPGWSEDMALDADDKSWLLSNLGPSAVWKSDGIISSPAGSVNSDGTPNSYWAAASFLQNTYAKTVAIRAAQYDVAAIAAAVVAVLPAPADGVMTEEEYVATVEQGVRNALGSLDNA